MQARVKSTNGSSISLLVATPCGIVSASKKAVQAS